MNARNSARFVGLLVAAMICSAGISCLGQSPNDGAPPKETQPKETPPKHRNRLADETSPYLLLHAHNPVDWYPWGPEALTKAKKEGKLIFLSIGYSSCHWCHVMERESFLDEEIAAFLNKHYVCIKVDREERPDIDTIYMTALRIYMQLAGAGRGGGWPLSMFLTPDAEPFFGGTYFPARDGDRARSIGFFTIIQRISEVWSKSPDRVRMDAATIAKFVKTELASSRGEADVTIDDKLLDNVRDQLQAQFDEQHGGFGFDPTNSQRPKFPEPANLFFLLDRAKSTKDPQSLKMLTVTLDQMAQGGIRDHLGGGFHRYSVDRYWRIPHFEKMLYDNGQLAAVYAAAFGLTGDQNYKRVTDEMLGFVLRELTADNGGFYSALDAESEGEEGKYYRWEKDEVQRLLAPEEFELAASIYGLDGEPNFEDEYYCLQLSKSIADSAEALGMSSLELEGKLQPIRDKLLAARSKRKPPLTDTKILVAWNGLMIRGLADAGRELKNDDYIAAATRAADFLLANLRDDEGRLKRTYTNGEAKLNGYLPDYVFLANGLIALHKATGDRKWLVAADELTQSQIKWFWDEANGGFFFTSADHEKLLARSKNLVDSARPSGNSVAVENLIYLAKQLDRSEYFERADKTIASAAGLLKTAPSAVPWLAAAAAERKADQ